MAKHPIATSYAPIADASDYGSLGIHPVSLLREHFSESATEAY